MGHYIISLINSSTISSPAPEVQTLSQCSFSSIFWSRRSAFCFHGNTEEQPLSPPRHNNVFTQMKSNAGLWLVLATEPGSYAQMKFVYKVYEVKEAWVWWPSQSIQGKSVIPLAIVRGVIVAVEWDDLSVLVGVGRSI